MDNKAAATQELLWPADVFEKRRSERVQIAKVKN